MGAYIFKFPTARVITLFPFGFFWTTFRIPAVYFLGFWFLQQAFNGLATVNVRMHVGMENGGVAYWAHAAGFVFGAILGALFGLFSEQPQQNEF
jgi:membrane associated rhomboid family serine protease